MCGVWTSLSEIKVMYVCICIKLKIESRHCGDYFWLMLLSDVYSCRTVSSVDTLFKYFIANSYLVQVPVECLLIYCLLDPHLTAPVVGNAIVWLLFNFTQTVIIAVAAASVNTQVTDRPNPGNTQVTQ